MVDYVIIGGGIIGLNIARALKLKKPDASITLIEKESEVAKHSSGRNSGVLHAGFYYTANSLKAKFTKEGNAALKDFCVERGLSVNECAKVVVAQDESELSGLEELKKRAEVNGVTLEWMSAEELHEKYPEAKTYQKALYSPSTATVDPVAVTVEFRKLIEEMGVEVITGAQYISHASKNIIYTSKGMIEFKHLINAAGLYADRIAKDFGFGEKYVIIPFKGIYLKDKKNFSGLTTNIYPVPNLANPFLGVHYTLTVKDEAKIGPTSIPAFWRENYQGFKNFDLQELGEVLWYEAKLFVTDAFGFRALAFGEVRKYIKSHFLGLATKLTNKMKHSGYNSWSTPGIRAQLLDKETLELVQDFIVEGDDYSTHVLNAVSPAFTCSMPFAQWVVDNHVLKPSD